MWPQHVLSSSALCWNKNINLKIENVHTYIYIYIQNLLYKVLWYTSSEHGVSSHFAHPFVDAQQLFGYILRPQGSGAPAAEPAGAVVALESTLVSTPARSDVRWALERSTPLFKAKPPPVVHPPPFLWTQSKWIPTSILDPIFART